MSIAISGVTLRDVFKYFFMDSFDHTSPNQGIDAQYLVSADQNDQEYADV